MDPSEQRDTSGGQKAQKGAQGKQVQIGEQGKKTQSVGQQDDQYAATQSSLPAITVPKGGGAVRGIGENFELNAITGTATTSIPISISQTRSDLSPQLTLTYDSGAGNGPFGFGWKLSLPSITRKTDKGLPRYIDSEESDLFTLTGNEDLLPVLVPDGNGNWTRTEFETRVANTAYSIREYRPRVEQSFSRIERLTNLDTGEIHWRVRTRENVGMVFGDSDNSKVFDPENPHRVFTWLVSQTYDDKGNVALYEYKSENEEGIDCTKVHERLRSAVRRSANRYPKRIKYGNRRSRLVDSFDMQTEQWMFEVVFDYGDHDEHSPSIHESKPWPARSDPFSTYRPTFELRTYRLCERILMFHNFPEESNIGNDCLVSSLDLKYRDTCIENASASIGNSIASFITSASHVAYLRDHGGYLRSSFPPLEFEYSHAMVSDEIRDVDPESLENLPAGLNNTVYQFLDLNSEGMSGVLSQQGGAYFYKPNIGNGRFGPVESVGDLPSLFTLPGESQQWLDLAGDGHKSLVQFDGICPGFYKRNKNTPTSWEGFRAFPSLPNISWRDSNMKLIDLRGTGFADVLIVNEEVFTYYPAWAEDGFGFPEYWRPPLDEDAGPRVLLSDGIESVYLADFSGDGLSDIVRVRNGEICYWPNLGYGRFGAKVTMDNAPWFDSPDLFSQSLLRLADVDGSGTTDIVYLGHSGVSIYLNQSGNSWTNGKVIDTFPVCTKANNVQVVDLLGQGTSCLVWSSSLPGDSGQQMRYINLMSQGKPYLMTSMRNNLGSETHVKYQTSTTYYLADKAAGKPWATRLPFPVQVVSEVETLDRINGNRFITKHAYHEGYYDGVEREFRGFGYVEKWDTEEFVQHQGEIGNGTPNSQTVASNYDPAFKTPPVWTKTWYHTGAFFENTTILKHFKSEFYNEPGLGTKQAAELILPETSVPNAIRFGNNFFKHKLSPEEERESYGSLKGSVLREETYSLDGSLQETQPYQVKQNNYVIDMLQPRGPNRYAMYFTHPKETVQFDYERALYMVSGKLFADPRVSHTLNLAIDEYGNVLEAVKVSYGRRHCDSSPLLSPEDKDRQKLTLATLTLQKFTNAVKTYDSFRTPLLCESQTFELVNFQKDSPHSSFGLLADIEYVHEIVKSLSAGCYDLPFEDFMGDGAVENHVYRRRLARKRSYFRSNDLNKVLPLGKIEPLALLYEGYTQVFTQGLVEDTFVGINRFRTSNSLVSVLEGPGAYVHNGDNENWWSPSGLTFFSPNSNDSSIDEFAYAREHFYLPQRYRDPFYSPSFNTESFAIYDEYDLLVIETRDALGNCVTVGTRNEEPGSLPKESGYDYRLLAPFLVMDANRNQTMAAYDILGHVTAVAVMGKPGLTEGDQLSGFVVNMAQSDITEYLRSPLSKASKVLGNATSRTIYDLWTYYNSKSDPNPLPVVTATLTRETHISDLVPGQITKIQQSFLYSDGFGRAIQTKQLAEPDPQTSLPRWVASGWQVFNNKGSVVRKYEPFFTQINLYEPDAAAGVSSTLFYDPLQRVVAKLYPNRLFIKTKWDPWLQEIWDQSDTVLINPADDPDVSGYFRSMPVVDYIPTWYEARVNGAEGSEEKTSAIKAVVHANTPTRFYFDALGRSILRVSHNALQRFSDGKPIDEFYSSRTMLDISGNLRSTTDNLGRLVETLSYDMANKVIQRTSMEAGENWILLSVTGKSIFSWNSRGYQLSASYDPLQRLLVTKSRQFNEQEFLVSKNAYGESESNSEKHNLRTKIIQALDQGTLKRFTNYDFKGNLLSSNTQYPENCSSEVIDWTNVGAVRLDFEVYVLSTQYDALNRQIVATQPDGSVIKTAYSITNQVQHIDVRIGGGDEWKPVLIEEQFNARNQRILSLHGNGVQTKYSYDPFTFNLVRITTKEAAVSENSKVTSPKSTRRVVFQDLRYTYDPMNNITHTRDDAQERIFFRNHVVDPSSSYTYDALNRLIEASGREHLGQSGASIPYSHHDVSQSQLSSSDGNAMGTYLESYHLDSVGNTLRFEHRGNDPTQPGWTRTYTYEEPSQIQSNVFSNRLTSTKVGKNTQYYRYNGNAGLNGNVTSMPHLATMQWDFRDHLQSTSSQRVESGTAEMTLYSYLDDGTRVRKVTNRSSKSSDLSSKKSERLYVGNYEIYREFGSDGKNLKLERKTIHVMNGNSRLALIDVQTQGCMAKPLPLFRYQYSNNVDSSVLELDDDGELISYEEYYPYGSTSYQAVRPKLADPKRYRYTGKERDEESGLYYHGARYYAPWIARWISPDPIGIGDDPDLYVYVKGNPIMKTDPTGTEGADQNKPAPSATAAPPASAPPSVQADADAPQPAQPSPDAGAPPAGQANGTTADNDVEEVTVHGTKPPPTPFHPDPPPSPGALDGLVKSAEGVQAAITGGYGKVSGESNNGTPTVTVTFQNLADLTPIKWNTTVQKGGLGSAPDTLGLDKKGDVSSAAFKAWMDKKLLDTARQFGIGVQSAPEQPETLDVQLHSTFTVPHPPLRMFPELQLAPISPPLSSPQP